MPLRPAEARTAVQGSRFRAWLGPAADPAAASRALAARSAEAPDATHHCCAYRTWDQGRIEGAGFDAGEPAGTAGRPILGSLERARVVQAVCVVSRWFGGVKLGTGGLTRAYGEAAAAALAVAVADGGLARVGPRIVFRVDFAYPQSGAVTRVLARFAARETDSVYGARVELEVSVDPESVEAFRRAIGEATGGAATARELGPRLESA